MFHLRQNEFEDNLNELLSGVKEEAELEKSRPYKIIKPDPGMYCAIFFSFVLFISLFRNRTVCRCVVR